MVLLYFNSIIKKFLGIFMRNLIYLFIYIHTRILEWFDTRKFFGCFTICGTKKRKFILCFTIHMLVDVWKFILKFWDYFGLYHIVLRFLLENVLQLACIMYIYIWLLFSIVAWRLCDDKIQPQPFRLLQAVLKKSSEAYASRRTSRWGAEKMP